MFIQLLLNLANNYLIENLEKYLTKELKPKEQDHKKATLTRLISRKDGRIFWSYSAQEIYNKFRAFYGWPGIYCFWKKDGFLKKIAFNEISRKEQGDEKKRQPGEVFKDSFGNVCIQSGEGLILPLEIQLEGKKSMSIKDFINGNPSFIGSQIK
jgi:methionyl-tRNA formyltransferase